MTWQPTICEAKAGCETALSGNRVSPPVLLIAGASVRAAVQSACRWGDMTVVAADLFVDKDLLLQVPAFALQESYCELPTVAEKNRVTHWCYTGGIENHPRLVDQVRAELWGNDGQTLRAVRDPWQVADCLQSAGIEVPSLLAHPSDVPTDGSWLRKPIASAGGNRIQTWNELPAAQGHRHLPQATDGQQAETGREVKWYWQKRIAGKSYGAAFVAAGGQSRLLGVTQQLAANVSSDESPFRYGGSFGPIDLTDSIASQWNELGRQLVRGFGLQGLFGVDAIEQSGRLWPIEVNPRYTASLEVLERAFGWNAMQLHVAACRDHRLPDEQMVSPRHPARHWVAKQIVYVPIRAQAAASFVAWALGQNSRAAVDGCDWPVMADIPQAGTSFPVGAPVLTTFATASRSDFDTDAVALPRLLRQIELQIGQVLHKLQQT